VGEKERWYVCFYDLCLRGRRGRKQTSSHPSMARCEWDPLTRCFAAKRGILVSFNGLERMVAYGLRRPVRMRRLTNTWIFCSGPGTEAAHGTLSHVLECSKNRHLKVIQWARANGCDWDESTCEKAVSGGHLNVIQWVRADGYPWN
jgi:hypothetical protein